MMSTLDEGVVTELEKAVRGLEVEVVRMKADLRALLEELRARADEAAS